MLWFIINHITEVKNQITEIKGHVILVEKTIVKIQTDIEYIKEGDRIEKDKSERFENHVVTILKEAKGRFK